MPLYSYEAQDHYGRPATGILEAASPAALRDQLSSTGFRLTGVRPYDTSPAATGLAPGASGPGAPSNAATVVSSGAPKLAPPPPGPGGKFLSIRAQSLLFREFAATFRAGMTLFQACDAIGGRFRSGALAQLVQWVKAQAAAGGGFADALTSAPVSIEASSIGIIRAGERGGFLPFVLDELASSFERQYQLSNQILVQKVLYLWVVFPLLLLTWPITGFSLASSQGMVDGRVTNAMQSLAVGGHRYAVMFLTQSLPIGLAAVLLTLFWQRWTRTLPGRRFADSVGLRLPVWGKMQQALSLSRFTRILASLYRGAVPLREAWILAADSVPNYIIMVKLRSQDSVVASNQPISAAMRATDLFDEGALGMIQTGEQTGAVEEMLFRLAAYQEETMERAGRLVPIFARIAYPLLMAPFVILIFYKIYTGMLTPFLNM